MSMLTTTPAPPSGTPPAPQRPTTRSGHAARPTRGPLIGANINSAVEALWANRLRSLLTALGIIIGVSAVIAAVSITQGASALINQRVAGLGTDVLTITPGNTTSFGAAQGAGTGTTLTQSDADGLASVPHVVAVSPVQAVTAQLIVGSNNWRTRVQGVYPDMQTVQDWQMAQGAFFTANDETQGNAVAVLGQTTYQNLFPDGSNPIGQIVLINNQSFTIVGLLQAKGAANGGFGNQDDVVYIPLTAAQTRLQNNSFVSQILVKVDNPSNVTATQAAITSTLESLHHLPAGGPDDFNVRNPSQFVQTAQAFSTTLTILLVSVAAISLVVGGIGIMNIMLVSVTERTREIGVRMALGSRRGDIRNQFLIESLALSAAGGLLGILFGLLIGYGITKYASLPFVPGYVAIVASFGVSAGIGILFGFYPAVRAANLDPIVALRSE